MRKIKSSTLVLTVVISFLLSLICASLLLLAYYNRGFQSAWQIKERLRNNAESAINLVLADTIFKTHSLDTLDLFEQNEDSVIIRKDAWGVYQVASVNSYKNGFSYQRNFMYGKLFPAYMDACVYVADHKGNLFVVGKTKLTGDAYLSKGGIQPGFINQRGFDFESPINGVIKESKSELPVLDSAHFEYLKRLIRQSRDSIYRDILTEHTLSDSVGNAFSESALVFAVSGDCRLQQMVVNGKCIVLCDSVINVMPTALFENVILVAPVIKFHEGWSGNVQAFSMDSIVVEDNCSFAYPSALGIIKDTLSEMQPLIRVGENCRIDGVILSASPDTDLYKTYIELGANSIVNGILYCQGYMNMKGDVNGIVMTDFFMSKIGITTYQNYLVDVSINRDQLSSSFVVPPIFGTNPKRSITKWLR